MNPGDSSFKARMRRIEEALAQVEAQRQGETDEDDRVQFEVNLAYWFRDLWIEDVDDALHMASQQECKAIVDRDGPTAGLEYGKALLRQFRDEVAPDSHGESTAMIMARRLWPDLEPEAAYRKFKEAIASRDEENTHEP